MQKNTKVRLPEHETHVFNKKSSDYAICIPILNEGKKIAKQLQKMKDNGIYKYADIIICDGGSRDGSTELEFLKKMKVNTLLIRKSPGHLSDQLMLGYHYAVSNGYLGVITIDGNGKDGIEGIHKMIEALQNGYEMVQGSRYIEGGVAINTPKSRALAIKLLHVPLINMLSGFRYTDTTNGFRAHSIEVFKDDRIQPFRYGDFPTYSLIHYLTVRAPRLGYRTTEVPVLRAYPKGKIPTKISPIKGNIDLLKIIWNLFIGKYDPKGLK